jgi:hypothetical protein
VATIVANTDFAYGNAVFQHQKTYDDQVDWVAAAKAAHPERFFASGGTKTCTNAFVFIDSSGGSFDRVVDTGDTLPSGDAAVTAAPTNFA